MAFGKRLRERREYKNLTQKELADRLFLGESTISFYEANKRQPKYEILEKIADILDTTTDYLLGRTDNPSTMHVAEEPPSYKTRTPDTDSVFQAKTLADAIIRIEKMRREFNLSKEWMYDMWDKAIEVYGQPEGRGGVAAHGPSYPGSGALDGGDEPR